MYSRLNEKNEQEKIPEVELLKPSAQRDVAIEIRHYHFDYQRDPTRARVIASHRDVKKKKNQLVHTVQNRRGFIPYVLFGVMMIMLMFIVERMLGSFAFKREKDSRDAQAEIDGVEQEFQALSSSVIELSRQISQFGTEAAALSSVTAQKRRLIPNTQMLTKCVGDAEFKQYVPCNKIPFSISNPSFVQNNNNRSPLVGSQSGFDQCMGMLSQSELIIYSRECRFSYFAYKGYMYEGLAYLSSFNESDPCRMAINTYCLAYADTVNKERDRYWAQLDLSEMQRHLIEANNTRTSLVPENVRRAYASRSNSDYFLSFLPWCIAFGGVVPFVLLVLIYRYDPLNKYAISRRMLCLDVNIDSVVALAKKEGIEHKQEDTHLTLLRRFQSAESSLDGVLSSINHFDKIKSTIAAAVMGNSAAGGNDVVPIILDYLKKSPTTGIKNYFFSQQVAFESAGNIRNIYAGQVGERINPLYRFLHHSMDSKKTAPLKNIYEFAGFTPARLRVSMMKK